MEYDRLSAQPITRKQGNEPFRLYGLDSPYRLLDFWQWSSSDLVGNTTRGLIAEYLVALALGIADKPRVEWEPYDLKTHTGITIEVKSSARFQTWKQTKPYTIEYRIGATSGYDAEGKVESEKRRQADVYVFCLLDHPDDPLDPLNLDHWTFYVLPTATLNKKIPFQKTVRLSSLLKLNPQQARFDEIAQVIASLSS